MPILILVLIALFVVIPGIRVVNQYERGVVQRLGRFRRIMEPGLHVIIPYIDTMRKELHLLILLVQWVSISMMQLLKTSSGLRI